MEELQEKTEIPVAFLEAMEADDFIDQLRSTFTLVLLRNMPGAVELDEKNCFGCI